MAKIKGILDRRSEMGVPRLSQLAIFFLLLALIYTRLVNIGWGLPYPFHPDERNMADAIVQLSCTNFQFSIFNFQNCFNPHFFAYGQLPLYFGYGIIAFTHKMIGSNSPISFDEAVISLRLLSAFSSIIAAYLIFKITELLRKPEETFTFLPKIYSYRDFLYGLAIIFVPGFIQFAHFGTTESLIIMMYTAIIFLSVIFLQKRISVSKYIVLSGMVTGLTIGIKVSSGLFALLPLFALALDITRHKKAHLYNVGVYCFQYLFFLVLFTVVSSPHNIISFNEFINSIHYESDVALGAVDVFYTRQFFSTIPVVFQFLHILPYTVGWSLLFSFLLSFVLLPVTRVTLLLRFAFLLVFLPNAFIYAKWTRFISPVLPVICIMGLFYLERHLIRKRSKLIMTLKYLLLTFVFVLPGFAYLSIYTGKDVRFQASNWIYEHVPANARILTETANVVDLPIPDPSDGRIKVSYNIASFNFYELDADPKLQQELPLLTDSADYIIIPSRRVVNNYTCFKTFFEHLDQDIRYRKRCEELERKYPLVNNYYKSLFSGDLKFKLVSEFDSYPKIKLFNQIHIFADEDAEETWTVFDHPVIQIFQRVK